MDSSIYNDVYRGIINRIAFMLECDSIMDRIKSEPKLASLNFLLSFDYNKRNEWIEKALADFKSIELFKGTEVPPALQCFLVHTYRKILQKKRKAGNKNPVVTEEEIIARITELANI